jgi:hypothetical protein
LHDQDTQLPSGERARRGPLSASLCAVLACLLLIDPAVGQVQPLVANGAIEALKPGEFLWSPDIAPVGPVTIIISLSIQRAYVYRNGVPIGVSTISSGKPGHETPTGVFTILQKRVKHKSNRYSNAPMPYMERLTWDGIAMHAGRLPGYPASHGCIRLPFAFAALVYNATKLGLTVVITDDPLIPEIAPAPEILNVTDEGGPEQTQSYQWVPQRSPTGPLSIIVSGRDKRMVVIRNGIEIGSARLRIDGTVAETMAFNLRAVDDKGYHWLRLPLPGQDATAAPELTSSERARVHMPEPFRKLIAAALEPGTTLLVTRESLQSGGTGKRLTVIDAEQKVVPPPPDK